jgi:hypothetical protein
MLHRNKCTISGQAISALPRIGEGAPIRRVLQRFGAGLFTGAEVSNAYE